MKADITRRTFRHEQHYSATMQQQGRVPLDADWNEQVEIQTHRDETETIDVIGASGVPKGSSFLPAATPDGKDITVAPGRAYVDGLLVENDGEQVVASATANTLVLKTIALDGLKLKIGDWVEVSGNGVPPKLFAIASISGVTLTLTVGPGENIQTTYSATPLVRRAVSYFHQPEWPKPDAIADSGTYIVFLDVWKRHITALEDPAIREVALGGPDTCTRVKTTWQLKLQGLGPGGFTCDNSNLIVPPISGGLSARAKMDANAPKPCEIPPSASYTRLENQLYRVEIHKPGDIANPGDVSTATFKFSIDNATLVTTVSQVTANQLAVGSTGKDSVFRFKPAQWIELYDDSTELAGDHGQLVKIATVGDGVLNLSSNVTVGDASLNPRVRGWDQTPATDGDLPVSIPLDNDGFIILDTAGVQIKFEPGHYNTGDYWLIPARTITRDVEWQVSEVGVPVPKRREGIDHHVMKLGLAVWDGTKFTVTDCRDTFPPLTDIHAKDVVMDTGPCQFPANVKTVQDAISELCKQKENACCELVVVPGDDVKSAIDIAIARNTANGIKGLHVCFAAGVHTLPTTLTITGPATGGGDITVSGCGLASHVQTTAPVAIALTGWTTATIRDLTISAGSPPLPTAGALQPTTPPPSRGAVQLYNNGASTVESCAITCGAAARKLTSCIAIQGTSKTAEARIADNDLFVGNRQVGITIVGIDRSTMEDNRIDVVPLPPQSQPAYAVSHEHVGYLRNLLFSDLKIGKDAGKTVATGPGYERVHATVNGVPIAWTADNASVPVWSRFIAQGGFAKQRAFRSATRYLKSLPPATNLPRITAPAAPAVRPPPAAPLDRTLPSLPPSVPEQFQGVQLMFNVPNALSSRVAMGTKRLVTKILRAVTSGKLSQQQMAQQGLEGFYHWVQAVNAAAAAPEAAAMSIGISVGGAVGNDVRILDNSIRGALSGVIAALSPPPGPMVNLNTKPITERLRRARIAGNTIDLSPPRGSKARHTGIYVGSSRSLTISDNTISNKVLDATSTAIYVVGIFGKMMRVEGNHAVSNPTGFHLHPQSPTGAPESHQGALWILSQNVAQNAIHAITITNDPHNAVVKINNVPNA